MERNTRNNTIFVVLVLSVLITSSTAQNNQTSNCQSFSFTNNRNFALCQSLNVLDASLHWTYNPTTSTVSMAYRASQVATGWIAWGLNLSGTRMIGTQAIVALQGSSSGTMNVFTTPISDRTPNMQQTPISYQVSNLLGEFNNGVMTIFATIVLPNNRTTFNHVWQESTVVNNGVPGPHPTSNGNVLSFGTIDFLSGQSTAASGDSILKKKNIHGVLNAISWGILMPIGAMIARYLKVSKSADPAWFYLHITCQASAYILGVAGWGLGLKLGSDSIGITHHRHRNIGITLFCLATLQVFALFLRPNPKHKNRKYWNVYHHSVGYTVIILSVVNVFKGFNILNPADKWENAYIGVIATLGGIALVLEIATWIVVLRRRSRENLEGKNGNTYAQQEPQNSGHRV